jgi:predicted RNA-binding Zn-ribbon protein involved in translation (DUF1610 family)
MSRAKISFKCPKCGNKDFKPKGPYCNPIIGIGGTERTKESIIRRYMCLECGYAWKSIEMYYEDLEVKGMILLEKLYNYMKDHMPRKERYSMPPLEEWIERTRRAKTVPADPKQIKMFTHE